VWFRGERGRGEPASKKGYGSFRSAKGPEFLKRQSVWRKGSRCTALYTKKPLLRRPRWSTDLRQKKTSFRRKEIFPSSQEKECAEGGNTSATKEKGGATPTLWREEESATHC